MQLVRVVSKESILAPSLVEFFVFELTFDLDGVYLVPCDLKKNI